ncbi:uncharacterized protein THITE_2039418 [Thermothielavioides terrestris NRRL 8126]|uniref:Protein kinase domain-containing protein n=1 Tax=Thermothielavioides terrestris (strain ATCC 38088 / NRRL 8126) TaxID=578455 RepID=G2QSL8_THETT|nr:uncharacterized protein THITE_2039418 [Thermothielavioides terrestris NRRL 8126]AEO63500.1 hypothetical protein THITE_2039418 [Thermothielavioides terrestris NRRL 8126]
MNSTGSHLASLPNPPKPLPQVPGPKLAPFTRTATATIQFIQELGNPEQDMDGRVWKVNIQEKEYALKMFRFHCYKFLRSSLSGNAMRRLASPQLYADYFEPFHCECRAYGRLKEENREDLAVRAYGYLLLTPQQEAEISRLIAGVDYDPDYAKAELKGRNLWGRWEEHRHLPVRAIVKELVSPQDPFTSAQLSDLWRDLEDLHRLGILVRDINVFNYMGGKLIDFGRAWTIPHPWPLNSAPEQIERLRQQEPSGLQGAIVEWGIGNGWDWGKVVIPDELNKCVTGESQETDRYGADPRLYDWRKWEKNPAAVDKFYEKELFAEEPESTW